MEQVKAEHAKLQDSPNKVIQLDEFLAARQKLMQAMGQHQLQPAHNGADGAEANLSGAG
jgi:hypothetical protein